MKKLLLAAILLLIAVPVKAGISVTGNACGKNSTTPGTTTTLTASCSTTVTQGNELVVLWETGIVGASAVCTDTMANVWVSVKATPSQSVGYCYAPVTASSGADTVTLTTTNSVFVILFSLELTTVNAFDVGGTASAPPSAASWTLPSVTTSQVNDIVIGFGGQNGANTTYTAGAGYTIPPGSCGITSTACGKASGGAQSAFVEYQIVTTATTYTPTVSLSPSVSGNTNTIAFTPGTDPPSGIGGKAGIGGTAGIGYWRKPRKIEREMR